MFRVYKWTSISRRGREPGKDQSMATHERVLTDRMEPWSNQLLSRKSNDTLCIWWKTKTSSSIHVLTYRYCYSDEYRKVIEDRYLSICFSFGRTWRTRSWGDQEYRERMIIDIYDLICLMLKGEDDDARLTRSSQRVPGYVPPLIRPVVVASLCHQWLRQSWGSLRFYCINAWSFSNDLINWLTFENDGIYRMD